MSADLALQLQAGHPKFRSVISLLNYYRKNVLCKEAAICLAQPIVRAYDTDGPFERDGYFMLSKRTANMHLDG